VNKKNRVAHRHSTVQQDIKASQSPDGRSESTAARICEKGVKE